MRHFYFPLVLCLAFGLIGCSKGASVKETLGFSKKSPDEFMVISHPPLSVPPEFGLRPPEMVTSTTTQSTTEKEAEEIIYGQKAKVRSSNISKGEQNLLNNAGTNQANSNIRQELLEDEKRHTVEQMENKEEEEGWFDRMIYSVAPKKRDPIVDTDQEEERIDQNKQEGKPLTEGETPTKDQGHETMLDRIF